MAVHRADEAVGPLLDYSALLDIEYTALKMVTALVADGRAEFQAGTEQTLGRDRMFFNLEMAVEKYGQVRASNRAGEPKLPAERSSRVGSTE